MLRLFHPSRPLRSRPRNVSLTLYPHRQDQLHVFPLARDSKDLTRMDNSLSSFPKEEPTNNPSAGSPQAHDSTEETRSGTTTQETSSESKSSTNASTSFSKDTARSQPEGYKRSIKPFTLPAFLDDIPWLRNPPSTQELSKRLDQWKVPVAKLSHLAREVRQDPSAVMGRMGQRVNEYTGYNVIEALKEAVLQAERDFYKAREDLETSKAKYEETIKTRAEGQRELNGLLQRKSSWSDQDLTRFTALYREEHAYEAAETEARTAHRAAEATVEQSYTHLVDAIRARYHEEQVWSDRIRAASTYGTWALMGIHVLLFLIVQTVVEPRKRRKLAERLEASLNEQRHTEEAILNQKLQALESSLLNHHAQMDRIEQNIHHLSSSSSSLSSSLATWVTSQAFPILEGSQSSSSVKKVVEEEKEKAMEEKHQDPSSTPPSINTFMDRHIPKWAREASPWQLSLASATVGGLASLCLTLLCSR